MLKGHNGSVQAVAAMTIATSVASQESRMLIVTAAADDFVIVWERQGQGEELLYVTYM